MQTYLVARFVPSLLVSTNQPRGRKKSPLTSEAYDCFDRSEENR